LQRGGIKIADVGDNVFFDVMEFGVDVRDIFGGWIGVRLVIVKINRVGEKGSVAKSCIEEPGNGAERGFVCEETKSGAGGTYFADDVKDLLWIKSRRICVEVSMVEKVEGFERVDQCASAWFADEAGGATGEEEFTVGKW
jgi:hypothetical protein